jgi:hypothetical protein
LILQPHKKSPFKKSLGIFAFQTCFWCPISLFFASETAYFITSTGIFWQNLDYFFGKATQNGNFTHFWLILQPQEAKNNSNCFTTLAARAVFAAFCSNTVIFWPNWHYFCLQGMGTQNVNFTHFNWPLYAKNKYHRKNVMELLLQKLCFKVHFHHFCFKKDIFY